MDKPSNFVLKVLSDGEIVPDSPFNIQSLAGKNERKRKEKKNQTAKKKKLKIKIKKIKRTRLKKKQKKKKEKKRQKLIFFRSSRSKTLSRTKYKRSCKSWC